ncbi:polyprotein [Phytophthora megakarya]|uniref:Polyprotein n=1 Tax=Phytophthora megakarya TaxID=4795 RepID=A0A225W2R6_9STRA|nr:polyprotein [Phytophthora megakarya]
MDDLAERFGQRDAKRLDNPCASNLKMSKTQLTRTDAGCLSRLFDNPGLDHWRVAIRGLRYLETMRGFGVVYNCGSGGIIAEAYTNAN